MAGLDSSEVELENAGWVKVALSDKYFCNRKKPTAEQRNWLQIHGYELKWVGEGEENI